MNLQNSFYSCLGAMVLLVPSVNAQTRLVVETDLGDIPIRLFDAEAPVSVANFLAYVERGDYDNSIFHRSMPGFVLQGGGFQVAPSGPYLLDNVPTQAPIINEFGRSNTRGTIAMAKLGGDPNSATSQWFVNLGDNSANLDLQNGGFTVFGEVEDFTTVDAIMNRRVLNLGGTFTDLPLKNLGDAGATGATTGADVEKSDFITIKDVRVTSPVPEPSSTAFFVVAASCGLTLRRR